MKTKPEIEPAFSYTIEKITYNEDDFCDDRDAVYFGKNKEESMTEFDRLIIEGDECYELIESRILKSK